MLSLRDARRGRVQEVRPAHRGELRMYTCGPAVSRYAPLGDLRSCLLPDLIRRVAELHGLQVTACQNIPDIPLSRAEGQAPAETARHYEEAFRADLAALNIAPAEHTPRATESVELMIALIARLIDGGHAYRDAGGSVWFDARSFAGYGELSGTPAGDWALWEGAAGPGLAWQAPWGRGFPGWHAECPALALHCLGEHIDAATGGIDLLSPHHEDVRAACDAAAGHEVVRHWAHGGHLRLEGTVMSRSAGNEVLLGDLVAAGLDPLAARLAFLEHGYRQQMSLSWDALAAADATLRRWREGVAGWARSPSAALPESYASAVRGAFDDDLDTPAALRAIRSLEHDESVPPGARFETFAYLDRLLGLDLARDLGRL